MDNEYLTQAANQQDNKGKEAAGPDKGTTRDGQTEEGRQTTRTVHTQTRTERIRKSETERGITEMRPRQKGPDSMTQICIWVETERDIRQRGD